MQKISQLFGWKILFLILVAAGSLLVYAASHDSAIFDESAHIPAGYSYVKYFDYRLNHEHPPLVKALSGIPLLFLDLKFPIDNSAWTTDVNGQWSVGGKFFYEYGNNAEQIIFWARIGPILLTLLLIFFLYIFARQFLGPVWALLPTLLFGLSPNVLAHGHLVTTDIGAAFGVIFSFYFFFRCLKEPTKINITLAGLAFGVAELLKFSNVLLAPIFIVLIVLRLVFNSGGGLKSFFKTAFYDYIRLAVVFI
ncbi:MAG: glycosyltransferase family 39 protein, partial [bacterium]|nr:glycosyltransferase family 39 protein [bacterium]